MTSSRNFKSSKCKPQYQQLPPTLTIYLNGQCTKEETNIIQRPQKVKDRKIIYICLMA